MFLLNQIHFCDKMKAVDTWTIKAMDWPYCSFEVLRLDAWFVLIMYFCTSLSVCMLLHKYSSFPLLILTVLFPVICFLQCCPKSLPVHCNPEVQQCVFVCVCGCLHCIDAHLSQWPALSVGWFPAALQSKLQYHPAAAISSRNCWT